ncbi:hypothetical protein CR513_40356, partial [Mucuna pruriens]
MGLPTSSRLSIKEKKVTLKPLSPKEVNKDQEGKKREKRKERKKWRKKKDRVSIAIEYPKKKDDKKKCVKGKEIMMTSRRVVRKVLLAKNEPLYLLPTNMYFQLSAQFLDLFAGFQKMLERFEENFPKDIPQGLPPIRGIEH